MMNKIKAGVRKWLTFSQRNWRMLVVGLVVVGIITTVVTTAGAGYAGTIAGIVLTLVISTGVVTRRLSGSRKDRIRDLQIIIGEIICIELIFFTNSFAWLIIAAAGLLLVAGADRYNWRRLVKVILTSFTILAFLAVSFWPKGALKSWFGTINLASLRLPKFAIGWPWPWLILMALALIVILVLHVTRRARKLSVILNIAAIIGLFAVLLWPKVAAVDTNTRNTLTGAEVFSIYEEDNSSIKDLQQKIKALEARNSFLEAGYTAAVDGETIDSDSFSNLVEQLSDATAELLKISKESESWKQLYEECHKKCNNCPVCRGEISIEEINALRGQGDVASATTSVVQVVPVSTAAQASQPVVTAVAEVPAAAQEAPAIQEHVNVVTPVVTQPVMGENNNSVATQPAAPVQQPVTEAPAVQEHENVVTPVVTQPVKGENNNSGATQPDPTISGKPLGDGDGSNGVGTGNVTPIYNGEEQKPNVTGNTVDFSENKTSTGVEVEDNHGATGEETKQEENPVVDTPENVTINFDYTIVDNKIVIVIPEGFKALANPYDNIICEGDVEIVSAYVENNTFVIVFNASSDAKITICEGLLYSDSVKSIQTIIIVTKTVVVEPDPSSPVEQENPTEEEPKTPVTPENPAESEQPAEEEMVVTSITVTPIADTGCEGDSLQYQVVAEGTNIDYSKLTVSMGTLCCRGVWTITAPAESGTATVSYGNVSQTVNFNVIRLAEESNETGESLLPEETVQEETPEPVEVIEEESDPQPAPEQVEEVGVGTVTGITLYDTSVVCGSDIQGEISFEGDVDWSKVSLEGLNGLEYDICQDGTITIHTSEVAANYAVTVIYDGKSVSTVEFAVAGVSDADILWNC